MTWKPECAFMRRYNASPVIIHHYHCNAIVGAHIHICTIYIHTADKFDKGVQGAHQNAGFFEETPTGGRMVAGWGQCTHSCFHGFPRWLSTESGIWVSGMNAYKKTVNLKLEITSGRYNVCFFSNFGKRRVCRAGKEQGCLTCMYL